MCPLPEVSSARTTVADLKVMSLTIQLTTFLHFHNKCGFEEPPTTVPQRILAEGEELGSNILYSSDQKTGGDTRAYSSSTPIGRFLCPGLGSYWPRRQGALASTNPALRALRWATVGIFATDADLVLVAIVALMAVAARDGEPNVPGSTFEPAYGTSLYRGIIAPTKRSAGLTTKIRSSNFTNLWP
jgi:hypothetical protein